MCTKIVIKINYANYALRYVLIWHNADNTFKRGMEVSLRSPNSMELVASATITDVDDKALGLDFVEVVVNYVMKKTTLLPRAQGKIKKMASAQSTCIHWPWIYVRLLKPLTAWSVYLM